jgi:hypothetical protein
LVRGRRRRSGETRRRLVDDVVTRSTKLLGPDKTTFDGRGLGGVWMVVLLVLGVPLRWSLRWAGRGRLLGRHGEAV